MSETNKKIKYLIADTTAFINAVPLNEYAENVLTVPDVVAEVRNKRQLRRLCVLPYDLQVREPRADSVKYCVEFAKKTGDYASLSGIDIKVVALTYELEKDNVGVEHLREEPVLSKIVASKNKPEELEDKTKLAGWYSPKDGEESDEDGLEEEEDSEDEQESESAEERGLNEKGNNDIKHDIKEGEAKVDTVKAAIEHELYGTETISPTKTQEVEDNNDDDDDEMTQEELDKLFEKLKCDQGPEDESCNILVPESKEESDDESMEDEEEGDAKNTKEETLDKDKSDEAADDGGWITPSNIKKIKKSLEGKVEDEITPTVACMSTDFAVQNVCMQINLHVAALNGRIIKQLRTYIYRCYACFKTTSIITKVFCPNCGNKTLKRVSVSIDENGKQVIHINTRRPLTSKYKNQSLPLFRGGKHSRNPILYEDQPIPRQMASRKAKEKTNALDDDYIAGFSPFVMRDVDSKSAVLRKKGNLKEWARNTNYEEDRRKKYYNRLYK